MLGELVGSIVYCTDTSFCELITASPQAKMINFQVKSPGTLEAGSIRTKEFCPDEIDPACLEQQQAYQYLLARGLLELTTLAFPDRRQHASWSLKGYQTFIQALY
jgi:hypothetical protein